jgi:hypothetical protein
VSSESNTQFNSVESERNPPGACDKAKYLGFNRFNTFNNATNARASGLAGTSRSDQDAKLF